MKFANAVKLLVAASLTFGVTAAVARGGGHGGGGGGRDRGAMLERCLDGHQLARRGRGHWTEHHCVDCPAGECVPGGGTFARNVWLCSPANCRRH